MQRAIDKNRLVRPFCAAGLAALALIMLFFAGCTPKRLRIKDFERYRQLPERAVGIAVSYREELFGDFEIEDAETIERIMQLLLNEQYVRGEKLGAAGLSEPADEETALLVYGETGEIYLVRFLGPLESNGYIYEPASDALLIELRRAGEALGALKKTAQGGE